MDRRRFTHGLLSIIAATVAWAASATWAPLGYVQRASAQSAAELWDAYAANPDNHPNIPNCSYAGYRYGEVPLPKVATQIYDVTSAEFGAVPNADADQTTAIQNAIAAAGKAGGGVVFLPEGKYRLDGLLRLNESHVVLRGASSDLTVLDFRRSLTQVLGANPAGSSSQWSWLGGLVWVGPEAALGGNEVWRDGETLANLSVPAARGDRTVEVDDAAKLERGAMVLLTFTLPDGAGDTTSFARHVYGDSKTVDAYNWAGAGRITKRRVKFPIEIAAVDKQRVTFRQPLRVDVRKEWAVRIEALGPAVSEFGIEGLRIEARAPASAPGHNQNLGFNGIYINRAYHGWVKDVVIANAENGLITAAVKTITVTNLKITGTAPQHHSMAARTVTTDCLFENFRIDGPSNVWHGINTEDFSAGNVWSKGFQARGTFDSHRALPFDFIRTEITTANDAAGAAGPSNPGGAGDAGPFAGRRVVHWNVDITGKHRPAGQQGIWILHPTQFPDGAQVGIRGAPTMPTNTSDPAWTEFGVPAGGARGSIVAGVGETPAVINLYEAQRTLRLEAEPGGGDSPDGEEPTGGAADAGTEPDPDGLGGSGASGDPDETSPSSEAGGDDARTAKSNGCSIGHGSSRGALPLLLILLLAWPRSLRVAGKRCGTRAPVMQRMFVRSGTAALGLAFLTAVACVASIDSGTAGPASGKDGPGGGDGPGEGNGPGGGNGPGEASDPEGGAEIDNLSAGPMPLRRLSKREYNNTVRDLLGEQTRPADAFPPERSPEFLFQRAGIVATQDATLLRDAAEKLAANAMQRLDVILPCSLTATDEAMCLQEFLDELARRAFRRPLHATERQRLTELHTAARATLGLTRKAAIGLLIEAILQEPAFLYHDERGPTPAVVDGDVTQLDAYQTASRLSYFLWGSMPDDLLFEAAEADALQTAAQVEAQAIRLLADPRARATVSAFFDDWLELSMASDQAKDPALYPTYNEELTSAMRQESMTFVESVVFDGDGAWSTLMTAPYSFINQPLAELYGVSGVTGDELQRQELDPGQRRGVLANASFLAGHGAPGGSHPVRRGVAIYEKLLCGTVPPPPPDVSPAEPASAGGTTRERYAEHGKTQCAVGCHGLFDQLGFAFEHYDGIGQYRELDNGKPVDASGVVTLDSQQKSFKDAIELMDHLAASESVQRCFTKQWIRFAFSRIDTVADRGSIEHAFKAFSKGENVRELLVAITTSRSFRFRTPAEGEVAP